MKGEQREVSRDRAGVEVREAEGEGCREGRAMRRGRGGREQE